MTLGNAVSNEGSVILSGMVRLTNPSDLIEVVFIW